MAPVIRTQAELEQRIAALEAELGLDKPNSTPPADQMPEPDIDDLYQFEDVPLLQLGEWLAVDNLNMLLGIAAELRGGASLQHEINGLVRLGWKRLDAELVAGEVQAMVSGRIPPGRMNAGDELARLRRVVAANLRAGQPAPLAIAAVTKALRNREFATWVVCGVRDELTHTPERPAPPVAMPDWASMRPEPKPTWSPNGEPIRLEDHVFLDPVDEAQGPLPPDPISSRTSA